MASLLDIGPLTKTIKIRGVDIVVKGVSALALFHVLAEFPELQKVFSNSGVRTTPEFLLAQAPGAIAAAVAVATGAGALDTEKRVACEAVFLSLSIGEQMELVVPIWEMTFPAGTSSFLGALEKLGLPIGSGWGQATPSPEQSKSSQPPATTLNESGTTPQDNSALSSS